MSDSLNKGEVVPEQYILITIYSLLAVTGLLGNLWVIMTVSSQLLGCGIAKGDLWFLEDIFQFYYLSFF